MDKIKTNIVLDTERYREFQKYLEAHAMKFSSWVRIKIEEELQKNTEKD